MPLQCRIGGVGRVAAVASIRRSAVLTFRQRQHRASRDPDRTPMDCGCAAACRDHATVGLCRRGSRTPVLLGHCIGQGAHHSNGQAGTRIDAHAAALDRPICGRSSQGRESPRRAATAPSVVQGSTHAPSPCQGMIAGGASRLTALSRDAAGQRAVAQRASNRETPDDWRKLSCAE